MQHTKRLYLVDEFDREYKHLQRPASAVTKARSAVKLHKTFKNNELNNHEKARQYVAELHRFLNRTTLTKQMPERQMIGSTEKTSLNTTTTTTTTTRPSTPNSNAAKRNAKRNRPVPKSLAVTGRVSHADEAHEAYTTPDWPGSFGGKQHLVKKFGKRKAERYLIGQEAYTLHKDVWKRFVRLKTLSKGIRDLFQVDLVDLTNLSAANDGVRYLLTCIDVFSKKAWAVAIRQKTASVVAKAFQSILTTTPAPRMLQTDKGTEFLNSTFQKMTKKYHIHFYTAENVVSYWKDTQFATRSRWKGQTLREVDGLSI